MTNNAFFGKIVMLRQDFVHDAVVIGVRKENAFFEMACHRQKSNDGQKDMRIGAGTCHLFIAKNCALPFFSHPFDQKGREGARFLAAAVVFRRPNGA